MEPVPPSWFKYRQGKVEMVNGQTCKLTAPNLPEVFLRIQQEAEDKWSADLRLGAEEPVLARSNVDLPNPIAAWEAAFELYRQHVVV
ncbi:MAG: hypothetical protein ACK4RK_07630 [Gemmataceae bacterium]